VHSLRKVVVLAGQSDAIGVRDHAEEEGRGDLGIRGISLSLTSSRWSFRLDPSLFQRLGRIDAYRVIRPIARVEINEGSHDVHFGNVD